MRKGGDRDGDAMVNKSGVVVDVGEVGDQQGCLLRIW